MASILPGFEYDIFISYRHNDNRSGWVSDFVCALQEELASTVKEPVSLYFDKNPHDGLLETHSVDKSLQGKLKCLIFMPVISQTYCDPKSFAWQHEFLAFNRLAKADRFGIDLKLGNGNVASRILPIKIHDLDAEDKTLLESELNGALRAIEFIFKFPGVNRPLTSTDKRDENSNKTFYRDQVNKVANAVKEIIASLKNPATQPSPTTINQQARTKPKSSRKPILIAIAALLITAISYFIYKQQAINEPLLTADKSVAVLAFADLSEEKNLEYLGDGVAEEIINVLAQTKDLKVIARSSSFQFKGKNEDLREMGKKLGVSTILEGSVRKFQGQIRVTAQLINVADGSHYWSKNMNQRTENLFEIQDAIAREVATALQASLLLNNTSKPNKPWNDQAQRFYQQGRFFYDRSDDGDIEKAAELFKKSVEIDSSNASAVAYIAASYGNLKKWDKSNYYSALATRTDSTSPEVRVIRGRNLYDHLEFEKAFRELSTALEQGNSNPLVLRTVAHFCYGFGNSKQGVMFARKALEVDPLIARSHYGLLQALLVDQNYAELLKVAKNAVVTFPQDQGLQSWLLRALILNGNYEEALKDFGKINDKEGIYTMLYFSQKNQAKLDSMLAKVKISTITDFEKCQYYGFKNDRDNFFKLINEIEMNYDIAHLLRTPPVSMSMRSDPRYQKLIEKYTFTKQFKLEP